MTKKRQSVSETKEQIPGSFYFHMDSRMGNTG